MVIKNYRSLALTAERKRALAILEAGYQAVALAKVLKDKVKLQGEVLQLADKRFALASYDRIATVGIGKCAVEAGKYLEKLLGKRLSAGIILDVKRAKFRRLRSLAGSHPLPSRKNVAATKQILKFLDSLNPAKDLLIFIVSGGGSSLFCLPQGITFTDYLRLNQDLQKSGATISELNCVRKHLEAVKGGKLAQRLYPLPTVGLYFSDVLGDDLGTIASGPLSPDKQTNRQAQKVLQKYGLWRKYRAKISGFDETPKIPKLFSHIQSQLLLTSQLALLAMERKARQLKLRPKILSATFQSEARLAFRKIKNQARQYPKANLFILGGETTVKVKGTGKGGRNQEAVLASLKDLVENEIFVAAASDGKDFTPAAGALADQLTRQKSQQLKLRPTAYLANNDSYNFFRKTKDFLFTGLTGTNVADWLLYFRK